MFRLYIGKGMSGSIIGQKWVLQPQSGGNFIALYYDAAALTGGKPTNNWKKVFSIVDTKLLPGWKPPDTQDCEIRISDTSGEKAYAGGLQVRKLTKPDIYWFCFYNSQCCIQNKSIILKNQYCHTKLLQFQISYVKSIDENLVMAQNPYYLQRFNSGRRL